MGLQKSRFLLWEHVALFKNALRVILLLSERAHDLFSHNRVKTWTFKIFIVFCEIARKWQFLHNLSSWKWNLDFSYTCFSSHSMRRNEVDYHLVSLRVSFGVQHDPKTTNLDFLYNLTEFLWSSRMSLLKNRKPGLFRIFYGSLRKPGLFR